MKPQRKQRLMLVGFLFVGTAAVVGFLLLALEQNVDLFYPPAKIVSGEAPVNQRMRAGGMVLEGSVHRDDSLDVSFVLSDMAGADFEVRYTGILPDLFREGQGIVATGKLNANGVFIAEQVLAKHDENYMPPELADMAQNVEETSGERLPETAGEKEKSALPPANWGRDS